jgi:hypothetical protein
LPPISGSRLLLNPNDVPFTVSLRSTPIAHAAAIALIASNSSRTAGSAVSFARSVNRSGRDTRGADEAFGSVAAGAFFAATFFFFGGGGRAAAT